MRVVIADDEVLLREGIARLLTEMGVEVVELVGDSHALMRAVALNLPDIAIVDIRMPPTHTDEGLTAAVAIRQAHPEVGVLVLSHYLDARYATRLLEQRLGGVGYLLKERVSDLRVLLDSMQRVCDGESVVDPTIVSRLMRRGPVRSPVAALTERERDVLAMMAAGHSNHRIATSLSLSPKTVERHIGHIFAKLGLEETEDQHRRVLAVLMWLRGRRELAG